MQMIAESPALPDLAAEFPGWHIWRGRDAAGRDTDWHATRRARLAPAEASGGMLARLSAGSAGSLREQLWQQQAITAKPGRAA
jgi:hypothetical protein